MSINILYFMFTFRITAAARAKSRLKLKREASCLRLAFLQFSALKTLRTLLGCSQYAELLLVPRRSSPCSYNKEGSSPLVHDEESTADDSKKEDMLDQQDESALKEALQDLMR
jgi:hypothetical protein